MPVDLSHAECLDLLANPSTQNIVEKLGFEYSERGQEEYRAHRPNIVPALVRAIVTELESKDLFPEAGIDRVPQMGISICEHAGKFFLMEIDKPSAWEEQVFATPEAAAKAYVYEVVDAYWLRDDVGGPAEPEAKRFSWES
jgi:hypothetical protein